MGYRVAATVYEVSTVITCDLSSLEIRSLGLMLTARASMYFAVGLRSMRTGLYTSCSPNTNGRI